ncbi:TnsD family Tn7-like transposition protein [Lysinibacillus boronitolerans]|uniref:TnsD family Tn7-like transposition protein n=1 Tax=Lysinibacillus boronitolerans TaxID=309788 RepID=UPI003854D99F
MLNNFPTLYPDELFYSAIARYKQANAIDSKLGVERDIYGIERHHKVGKSVYFPQRLGTFIDRLPFYAKLSVDELIWGHTMFPFYTAFMTDVKTNTIFDAIKSGNQMSIENMVGIPMSKIKTPKFLRYCPCCYEEDLNKLGESYWRRLPQVPGVLYCPTHKVLYKNSAVDITTANLDYVCADSDVCNEALTNDENAATYKALDKIYVRNVQWLMQNRISLPPNYISSFYIDRLREMELTSYVGNIKMTEFLEAFQGHYPTNYLELMQSAVSIDERNSWPKLFIRNTAKNRSALRHLLMLQFLKVQLAKLFEIEPVIGKRQRKKSNRVPIYSSEERKEQWLMLLAEHPNANRKELSKINNGLFAWLRIHEREWFDKVTPKNIKTRNLKWNL